MKLVCKININSQYEFDFFGSVKIESSWKTLGDKATIVLPLKGVLKRKDATKEALGYDGNLSEEFVGYISKIKPSEVIELVCEDELYKYKRKDTITDVYNGTLKGLLDKYFTDSNISESVPDMVLSNFILKRATPAELLEKIKENYSLACYFRSKTLYVGLPYNDFGEGSEVKLNFQKNTISSRNLTYNRLDDVRIRIKAVSFLKDNTKVEVETGDKDGELRTLFFYGETDKDKIEKLAISKLEGLKQEGYTGSVDIFGIPVVRHSDKVVMVDARYTERSGQKYFADGVIKEFKNSSYRQTVSIGIKVN
jgi:hypothetical protein